jgi:hypothetical protein
MTGAPDAKIALETRLAAIASPLATQWENALYTPISGTPYQQAYLLLAEPNNSEMGRYYQEQGIFQINLRYPINVGAGAAWARAQALREWFYRGLSLAANGLTVTINRTPTIAPGAIDGDRYVLPVKARFVANNAT